jgi:LAO/AO transport system kinase
LGTPQQLADAILKGDGRAIARSITLIENNAPEAQRIIAQIYPHTGRAQIIGVTGPGGAGKSTLVEKLVRELRRRGKTTGIIGVDPTSPFSGGAFLGDRIRMQDLSTDEGVFIRSMATRNNPGGLAQATKDAVRILDAAGKDVVIVETVGAGQSEVDIIKIAQTVVVVLAPGLGDEIQAIKAGMMEIGDIFVVNKADRENANKAVTDIQGMLELTNEKGQWRPPVIKTVAMTGDGTQLLLEKIAAHRDYLAKGEASLRQRRVAEMELAEAIRQLTTKHVIGALRETGQLDRLITKIMAKEIDPVSAAEQALIRQIRKPGKEE